MVTQQRFTFSQKPSKRSNGPVDNCVCSPNRAAKGSHRSCAPHHNEPPKGSPSEANRPKAPAFIVKAHASADDGGNISPRRLWDRDKEEKEQEDMHGAAMSSYVDKSRDDVDDPSSSLSEDCSTKEDVSAASSNPISSPTRLQLVPVLSMKPLKDPKGFHNVHQALKVLSSKACRDERVASVYIIAQSLATFKQQRPVELDCKICGAFISVLDSDVISNSDATLPSLILSSLLIVLTVNESDPMSAQTAAELGLYSVHLGIVAKLIATTKSCVAVSNHSVLTPLAQLLLSMAKLSRFVSHAIFSTHLIRDLTDICLNNVEQPVGVVMVCDMMFNLMAINSGFDQDHNLALYEATEAMRLYPSNISVGRITAVLLSQRKWSGAKLSISGSREFDLLQLTIALLRKWKRDKCILLCCIQALCHAADLASIDSILDMGACSTLMELVYRNKQECDIVDAISRTSQSLCKAFRGRDVFESQSIEGMPVNHKALHCVDLLNSLAMDYRWKMRRNFCLFLAQTGFIHNPRSETEHLCDKCQNFWSINETSMLIFRDVKLCAEIASFL